MSLLLDFSLVAILFIYRDDKAFWYLIPTVLDNSNLLQLITIQVIYLFIFFHILICMCHFNFFFAIRKCINDTLSPFSFFVDHLWAKQ